MSLEITLRVNGSDYSENGSSHPAENLVNLLRGLEGILNARYDWERQRFAVRYDQNRITILRILRQIELAGHAAGRVYRPTDVQPSNGDSFPTVG
ncbi:MAG: hypothetical protein ACE5MM_02325 [Nitrospiraceae bacterium]